MENNDLTIKEKMSTLLWVCKRIHNEDRNYLPLELISIINTVIMTYLPILIMYPIIDELIKMNFNKAFYIGIIFAILLFLTNLLNKYINVRNENNMVKIGTGLRLDMHLHNLDLDYESSQETEYRDKFSYGMQSLMYIGGFSSIIDKSKTIIASIISIILAIGITIKLILSKPNTFKIRENLSNETLKKIASPVYSAIIIFSIIFITLLIVFYFQNKYQSKIRSYFDNHAEVETQSSYVSNEISFNTKSYGLYQVYGFTEWVREKNREDTKRMQNFFGESTNSNVNIEVLQNTLATVILILSYMFVTLKYITGAIEISMIVTFVKGFNQLNTSFTQSVSEIVSINSAVKFYNDIKKFVELENKMDSGSIPVEKRRDNEVAFEFKNVSFKYPHTEDYVIENLNLKLTMNKKHALVGPNGCGKTTFIKLLTRLYEPTEGEILLNGINIKKYDYKEYLSLFSVVFQDFKLFNLSLGENVACKTNYEKEKVIDVLKKSGFFSEELEYREGMLEENIGNYNQNNFKFSGGQLQKIAIARALYKNSQVAILDEPTAALDPKSESEIYNHLNELIQNKTTVFISHRMSSCRFCEDIIVFNEGKLEERGNHNELLKTNGLYKKMWEAQAKYYA